jgi:hypothetical protein
VTASGEFEALHAEAKGIFFGALKACDIASSLDLRIQFDGNLLHRLAGGWQQIVDDRSEPL